MSSLTLANCRCQCSLETPVVHEEVMRISGGRLANTNRPSDRHSAPREGVVISMTVRELAALASLLLSGGMVVLAVWVLYLYRHVMRLSLGRWLVAFYVVGLEAIVGSVALSIGQMAIWPDGHVPIALPILVIALLIGGLAAVFWAGWHLYQFNHRH